MIGSAIPATQNAITTIAKGIVPYVNTAPAGSKIISSTKITQALQSVRGWIQEPVPSQNVHINNNLKLK